jgi:hypothetical protein
LPKLLQLPAFAFSWPHLLPNGVSMALLNCRIASFHIFPVFQETFKSLKGSAAALGTVNKAAKVCNTSLRLHSCRARFATFLAMPVA